MYIIKIAAIKNLDEIQYLKTFEPIAEGTRIGYAADKDELNGIKQWFVCACEEVNA